jgi:hypothetical protein
MNRSPITILALALNAVAVNPLSAEDQPRSQAEEPVVRSDLPPTLGGETQPSSSRFSLDLSVRFTSDYFFRGIAQKTDSFNLQPSAELGFTIVESGNFTLSVFGGTWSSFSDDRADGASGSFSEYWYEHDAYVGVSAGFGRVGLDAIYTWYASPSSDFTEYEDLTLSLSFDDSGLWDDGDRFSINPSVSVAFETKNAAVGPDSGVWLGLGLEPSVLLGETPLGPTTLSIPLAVGLSLDDYYQRADGSSETFGYAEVGVKLAFDLSGPLGSAAPTLDIGASYLFLEGALDDFNGGDSGELMFSAGLSWSF